MFFFCDVARTYFLLISICVCRFYLFFRIVHKCGEKNTSIESRERHPHTILQQFLKTTGDGRTQLVDDDFRSHLLDQSMFRCKTVISALKHYAAMVCSDVIVTHAEVDEHYEGLLGKASTSLKHGMWYLTEIAIDRMGNAGSKDNILPILNILQKINACSSHAIFADQDNGESTSNVEKYVHSIKLYLELAGHQQAHHDTNWFKHIITILEDLLPTLSNESPMDFFKFEKLKKEIAYAQQLLKCNYLLHETIHTGVLSEELER